MNNRRDFFKNVIALGGGTLFASESIIAATLNQSQERKKNEIWCNLIHLSFNLWEDHDRLKNSPDPTIKARIFDDSLRLSEQLWDDSIARMKHYGMNMALLDLGDAIKYDSHPEIAVKNAWSVSKLKKEVKRLKAMGIEPIPKLNFSAGHDAWLGKYSHMLSTDTYYKVCKDLVEEVVEIFENPRFFHIGYDEEDYSNQRLYDYVVLRQNDLWWKDLYYFVDLLGKHNARPWIWSDYAWEYPESFYSKMPKEVIQSNWYYKDDFSDLDNVAVKTYLKLEKNGFDQIPTAGYYEHTPGVYRAEKSAEETVKFSRKHISDNHLLGFIQTNWRPTIEVYRQDILKSIDLLGKSMKF